MRKNWFHITKGLMNVSQLGITTLAPLIFCIWGSLYLQQKFALGNWVVAVGVLIGFGAGITAFIGFLRRMLKDFEKPQ